jgi:hypothetical protein
MLYKNGMLLVALAHTAKGLDLSLLVSLKMEKFLAESMIQLKFVLLLKILKIYDTSSCRRLDDDDDNDDDDEACKMDCT